MIKCFTLCFLCLLLSGHCWPQRGAGKSKSAINNTTKTQSASNADASPKLLLDVLFATNEDCDLYINNELKGPVLKSSFRYLKLSAGTYTYKAVTKTTFDELTDSFTVAAGGANEFFLDLLYLVDEKKTQRESVQNKRDAPDSSLIFYNRKVTAMQEADLKKRIQKAAETAVINSLAANMIPVKGGVYLMGNNKAPFANEKEHPVTISPVLFSKYEVTRHQWETIMGYNPAITKDCPVCPVENVSWEDAIKFITKLNSISNKKFRLPTEAEWEYMARIGGKMEIDTSGGQEQYIKKTAWYFGNSDKRPHPVGTKKPNVAGVFDLMGNVSEWCSDWYGAYYYKEDFNQLNPKGPPLGKEKIIRGGNYKDFVGDRFRPSFRNKRNPVEKSSEVGFRLVMDVRD